MRQASYVLRAMGFNVGFDYRERAAAELETRDRQGLSS